MQVYKTTNLITGKFYVGKELKPKDYYFGSGRLIRLAISKHGKHNFVKETLELCDNVDHLNEREIYWIEQLDALGNQGYNMRAGGRGGDNSMNIDYEARGNQTDNFAGAYAWYNKLSRKQQKQWHEKQAMKRTKGWYVSRMDNPTETYVENISKWCEKHNVDKSMPTALNNVDGSLFQKQTKGWRIRRSNMPKLKPYENRRHIPTDNKCKGRTWKLVNGKRQWADK